jgi:hypothetical protein
MIKVTYKTIEKGLNKPEITTCRIFNEKYFVSYNIPGKAESTVIKMKQDGRKNVLFSRGQLIQVFKGKNEKEILEIVKKDIENGLIVAESKGKKLKIEDLTIEEK